jgi:WD40 repeat protein
MTSSAPPAVNRIFICYRREETAAFAGWLSDVLKNHFGVGQVFKDVESIQPGDDFVDAIATAVGSCAVLLALIGDRWLTITDKEGRHRLDDPEDYVRLEIGAALERGVRVIPVLVEGALMPRADQLPPPLAGLVRRQALKLTADRFGDEVRPLLGVLANTFADMQLPHPAPGSGSAAGDATTSPQAATAALEHGQPGTLGDAHLPGSPSALARSLTGHTGPAVAVAFDLDGRLLATASHDGTARLWDLATGDCLRTLTGHNGWVNDVAFSPDGRLLATASGDGTARLWDPATGGGLRTLTGHARPVHGVAFSPDGHRLATASDDGTARLWDPATGGGLRRLTGHIGGVWDVAFSPDGRLLATAGDDGTARLWDPAA